MGVDIFFIKTKRTPPRAERDPCRHFVPPRSMGGATTCSAPHRKALELIVEGTGAADVHAPSLARASRTTTTSPGVETPSWIVDASREGCLACLRYANENRIFATLGEHQLIDACEVAAEHGNWECVKYFAENACRYSKMCGEDIMIFSPTNARVVAAAVGNLEMLKYLHDDGCFWDEHAVIAAILNGDLESLKYLLHADDGDPDWCALSDLEGVLYEIIDFNWKWDTDRCGPDQLKCLECLLEKYILDGLDNYLDFVRKCERGCPIKLAMAALDEVKEGMSDGPYKTIADGLMYAYRRNDV